MSSPRTPLRIAIIDDEQPARNRLRELLEDCRRELPHLVAGEAANGIDALDVVSESAADVALADIHMPGMGGIEFARHLQLLESPPAVIFITAHDQYAVQAFEVNAIDYLLKPVRAARLLAALKKVAGGTRVAREAFARLDPNPRRYFSVADRGRITLVPVAEVLYLRSELKYVTLRTRSGEHLIEEALTQLEAEFAGVFVRIHRSCLVARRFIRGVQRERNAQGEPGLWVTLDGCAEKLPVSRRQWAQLKGLVR